jgi:16S rRNA (cytosine967-C5)-methyltransferase
VLNSRPDLRWRARPLPELQLDLLRVAVERTRPGGSITYSVCTISKAENEDVVDTLGLPTDDLGAAFPDFRHPRRAEFLLTLPHVHRTSGFFIARLRRP